jgi:hypothetical protein
MRYCILSWTIFRSGHKQITCVDDDEEEGSVAVVVVEFDNLITDVIFFVPRALRILKLEITKEDTALNCS